MGRAVGPSAQGFGGIEGGGTGGTPGPAGPTGPQGPPGELTTGGIDGGHADSVYVGDGLLDCGSA